MAKPKPSGEPTETTLERTAKLARKLLAVPKAEAEKEERKYRKRRKPS